MMDEIVFRASQRVENLQIQFNLAAQHLRFTFQQYSDRGAIWMREALDSPRMARVQDVAKELLLWALEVMERSKQALFKVADPRKIAERFLTLLRNELTRQQIYCGCFGFILGAIVGYSVASFVARPISFLIPMKAAVCTSYKGVEWTALMDDIQSPKIEKPNDILIKVKAACVSEIDSQICYGYGRRLRSLLRKYNYSSKTELPVIIGRSCSGVVLDIGEGVTKFDIGDEVYLSTPFWSQGTVSELFVAKDFRVAHKPKRIGFEAAAGLPYSGSIALNAIKEAEMDWDSVSKSRVLICGANTAVGCILVQFCHMMGAYVTTTSTVRSAHVARALGADEVIITNDQTRTKNDLETKPNMLVKELTLRDLYDVIFITNESDTHQEFLHKVCKPNGKIIPTFTNKLWSDNFGFLLGSMFWAYVRTKCFFQRMYGWELANFGEPILDNSHLEKLTDLVDNKQLESVVEKVFQPEHIEQALEHVQSKNSIGSTIITFL